MKKVLILVFIIAMIVPTFCYANGTDFDFRPDLGKEVPPERIEIIKNREDSSFQEISYVISSTGGGGNIRYRTSEIRIVVAGNVYRLNTLELQQMVPNKGETVHSLITINTQHIINGMNKERKKKGLKPLSESEIDNIKNSLNDPSKIEIEANIDIYNKATGEVLDRITDINNISKIAGKYGFSTKHMNDMESRFRNKPIERTEETGTGQGAGQGTMESETHNKKGGLRPTGIRY